MRCFILVLLLLGDGKQAVTYVNRDLMTTVSPTVTQECRGAKALIVFNSSNSRCAMEYPDDIVRKGCIKPEKGATAAD